MSTTKVFEETLTVTAAIHADKDVLAAPQEIKNAFPHHKQNMRLDSISLFDADDQGAALDIVLMRSNISLGTENVEIDLADGDGPEIIDVIEIGSGDYIDLVDSQIVSLGNLNRVLTPGTSGNSSSLFIGAISRGTGTYAGGAINVKLGIIWD